MAHLKSKVCKNIADVSVFYSIQDKAPQWIYFGVNRTEKEKQQHPIHKTDEHMPNKLAKSLIRDGRFHLEIDERKKKLGDLDEIGFELVNQETSLSTEDFYKLPAYDPTDAFEDDDEKKEEDVEGSGEVLRKKLYHEVESFLENHLGAESVVVFNHQVRNASDSKSKRSGKVDGYVTSSPHTDATYNSGDETYLWLSSIHPKLIKNQNQAKRYMYLNLWRNISEDPIQNNHLAMLDDRSVIKPDSYVPYEFYAPGFNVTENGLNYRWNRLYKWYYFPDMKKNEAILFKQADCDYSKPARSCFHMSVADPTVKDALPRQSIELRCLAIFTDDNIENTLPTPESISSERLNTNGLPPGVSSTGGNIKKKSSLSKIPVIGSLFRKDEDETNASPESFVTKITEALVYVDEWSKVEKAWARKKLKSGTKSFTEGMVDDYTNEFGLKHTSSAYKILVKEACLKDENYLNAVEEFSNKL